MSKNQSVRPTVSNAGSAIVVTATDDTQTQEMSMEERSVKILEKAMKSYDLVAKQSSAFLSEKGSYNSPSIDELGQLAEGPQDSIRKILRINSIVSKYSNLDDVLGTVSEAIRINLNTDYRLNHQAPEGRNKAKTAARAKSLIESLNDEIQVKRLIREQIPRAYMEGNVVMYLRQNETGWVVDTYPLGVAEISPYSVGGEPIVLIDMNELRSRLSKAALKMRNGKNMFFDSIDEEIKKNFPKEIYDAHVNRESYAKLDPRYTGVMRVNNNGRKYGVTPMFKAMGASLILETFQKSDMLNAKARTKKIILQLLDPVLLGKEGTKTPIPQQQYAHTELVTAYTQPGSCLFTAPAYTKDVKILEAKGDMVEKDTVLHYLHKQMSALGIGFLTVESNSSVSSAKISLDQLMRNINSISFGLEEVLAKFYRQVLIDEGLPPEYAPTIKILDSESLETDLKIKVANLLYTTLNCSLKTAMEVIGVDYDEEVVRRREENERGIEKEFFPRQTSYTYGGGESGRPRGEETDKQGYDDGYNETR